MSRRNRKRNQCTCEQSSEHNKWSE